ncbi:MAG: heme-copper oxidase subunit III [Phycisphaerales bacterium]|nr:heme-copper oxidase subunit III [Phycisphaerales bacterium]
MSTLTKPAPACDVWRPSRGKIGMICLITAESCIFLTFVVAYLFYIGKSATGPQPAQVLELGLVILNSIALISSSFTAVAAVRLLEGGNQGKCWLWLAITIALGAFFVGGTIYEWSGLMRDHALYPTTNLFGTTFYSLVGLHLFHVIVGLILLSTVLAMGLLGWVKPRHAPAFDLLSWYWHFVDAVWIVVFVTVYVIGR